MADLTSAVYTGEIAPPAMRCRCVTLTTVMLYFGTAMGVAASVTIENQAENNGSHSPSRWLWNFHFGGICLVAAALLVLVPFLPESPRWLAGKGRTDDARAVLVRTLPRRAAAPDSSTSLDSGDLSQSLSPTPFPVKEETERNIVELPAVDSASTIDWRQKGAVTPVKNQVSLSS